MAMKRRVNKRFLIVVTLALVLGGVLAFVAKRLLWRPHPQQYIQLANRAMTDQKYEEAAKNFFYAYTLSSPKDPDLLIKQGDALRALTAEDPESFGRDIQAYNR